MAKKREKGCGTRRAEGLTVLNARLAAQASESKRERDSEAKSAGSAMGDGGGVEI